MSSTRDLLLLALVAIIVTTCVLSPRGSLEGFDEDIGRDESVDMTKLAAVVINLDRNVERMMRIMAEYKESDVNGIIPVRRFAAVDASKIDVTPFVTPKAMEQIRRTIETGYRVRHYEMTMGAVGCFLSHISVMRMLLQDDSYDTYLILEDDAVVPADLRAALEGVTKKVPAGWDIILLGYHYKTVDGSYVGDATYERLTTFWGTHAVLVNKRGARKIVDEYQNNKISMQVDSMMSLMAKHGRLNVYATTKQMVTPGHFGTDIQVPIRHVEGINPFDLETFVSL